MQGGPKLQGMELEASTNKRVNDRWKIRLFRSKISRTRE